MTKTAFKIAASTMIVSLTMVPARAQSEAMRRARPERPPIRAPTARPPAITSRPAARCSRARSPRRMTQMETAVALSPRDAGYRLLLADIYMKSGRFDAARATFADVDRARSVEHPRRPQPRADAGRARPSAGRRRPARRAYRPRRPPISAWPMRSPACPSGRSRSSSRPPARRRRSAAAPESRSVLRPRRRLAARPHHRRAGHVAGRPRPAPPAMGGDGASRCAFEPGRGVARRDAGPGSGPAGRLALARPPGPPRRRRRLAAAADDAGRVPRPRRAAPVALAAAEVRLGLRPRRRRPSRALDAAYLPASAAPAPATEQEVRYATAAAGLLPGPGRRSCGPLR